MPQNMVGGGGATEPSRAFQERIVQYLAMTFATALELLLCQSRGVILAAIPLLIFIAVVLPYHARRYPLGTALLLLLFQTAALFHPSFSRGGVLIQESRIVFLGLVSIFACILLLPKALHKQDRRLFSTAMLLAFLFFYAAGAVILSAAGNTGVSDLLPSSHLSFHAGQ